MTIRTPALTLHLSRRSHPVALSDIQSGRDSRVDLRDDGEHRCVRCGQDKWPKLGPHCSNCSLILNDEDTLIAETYGNE